jgi:hypothetical protein
VVKESMSKGRAIGLYSSLVGQPAYGLGRPTHFRDRSSPTLVVCFLSVLESSHAVFAAEFRDFL